MPLFALLRPLFAFLSWAVLALSLYLLWTGYQGVEDLAPDGTVFVDRDPWRLWLGAGLLAFSFLGRFPVLWLTTRAGEPRSRAARIGGRRQDGASGSQLYVENDGAGPTVILTHGWGLDSTIWRTTKADLRRRFHLLSWDLPGLGLSRLANGDRPTLEGFAQDLRGLVLAQTEPVLLVGHSIGGMTIQTLARDHPELFGREVMGVVLLNTTYPDPSRTMVLGGVVRATRPLFELGLKLTAWLQPLAWLSAWQSYLSGSAHLLNRLGFGARVTRSQLEHTTLLATRNPPGVQALGILAMLRWDADGALSKVGCPVRVIGGDVDLVTKLEASKHIAASSALATLLPVAGANHMGFLEHSEIYNAEIAAFVDHVAPRNASTQPVASPPVQSGPRAAS